MAEGVRSIDSSCSSSSSSCAMFAAQGETPKIKRDIDLGDGNALTSEDGSSLSLPIFTSAFPAHATSRPVTRRSTILRDRWPARRKASSVVQIDPSHFISVSKERLLHSFSLFSPVVEVSLQFSALSRALEAAFHRDSSVVLDQLKADYRALSLPPLAKAFSWRTFVRFPTAIAAMAAVPSIAQRRGEGERKEQLAIPASASASAPGEHSAFASSSSSFSSFDTAMVLPASISSPWKQLLARLAINKVHEDRFFCNFLKLMRKGDYEPVTRAHINAAAVCTYQFSIPIEVQWDNLCNVTLARQLADPSVLGVMPQELPSFVSQLLLLYRGVGIDKTSGLFLADKLNLLSGQVLRFLWARISHYVPRKLLGAFWRSKPIAESVAQLPPSTTAVSPKSAVLEYERVTLASTYANASGWLRWLFTVQTLQEPTFKRVVMVYRDAARASEEAQLLPSQDELVAALADSGAPEEVSAQIARELTEERALNHTGELHIKQFRDIPIADLEVLYPHKKMHMRSFDFLSLAVVSVFGFMALLWNLIQTSSQVVVSSFSASSSLSVASVFGSWYVFAFMLVSLTAYTAKSYTSWQSNMSRYWMKVNEQLYEKSLDSGLGVILAMMDSMQEQQLKEALLAYFVLWREQQQQRGERTRGMGALELKCKAERFLLEQFGLTLAFDVDAALFNLDKLGLLSNDINLAGSFSATSSSSDTTTAAAAVSSIESMMDDSVHAVYSVVSLSEATPTLNTVQIATTA